MDMNFSVKKIVLALFLSTFGMLTLTACDTNDGPVEEMGEEVDEAANDLKRDVEDATD